ncbi:MAG: phosphotransferase [Eggerthellaceae bacterium]|nr:phosphotransferase [Eggerthellaceae bacterium]
MTHSQASVDLNDAHSYLESNAALREALDVPRNAELVPSYLGEGEHNRNFQFAHPVTDEQFVLRINTVPQPFHDNQVRYEFSALKLLKPCGRTPKPLYLDDSPQAPGEGAMVIGFCEGDALDFDHLRPGEVQCAIQLMADIHAVHLPDGIANTLYRPADPLRALFDECLQRFKAYQASGVEDASLTRWTERFIAAAQDALATPCQPQDCTHIVNTETLASHFLIPEASARAAAQNAPGWREHPGFFIDWERPIIGEVAQDLAYFVAPTTTFWDSEFMFPADQATDLVESYWDAVGGRFPRKGFDARFRAWSMMTALRSTTWFCKALPDYRVGGAGRITEKTMRKFPTYLSDEFMEMLAKDCFGL